MSEVEKKFENWIKNKGYEYLKKGWPDYAIYDKKEVVFVEVKKPHEPLKPHQMKMHMLLKNKLGIKVKIATPTKNGFALKESGFMGFDQEDLKIVKGLLNYKILQDKLESLRGILESWADNRNLAKRDVRIGLGRVWMAFALNREEKAYNQPNFYISFSDRLTGKLHIEVGLHFRNIKAVDNFSDKVIETIMSRKEEFLSSLLAKKELAELELFLASGRAYKKVEAVMLSELSEEKLLTLRETYRKNKDVRVIFMKMYEPQQILVLGDQFSEEIKNNFENLFGIFSFLRVGL